MPHVWKCHLAVLSSLLLSVSCGAVASQAAHADSTATTVHEAWAKGAVTSLSAMPDTNAMVTAGVLAGMLPNGEVRPLDLLDRAAASAPQATDIGLLDITACRTQPNCDALKREARMRRVDPRNGNFWIVALHDASKRADRPRIDAVLALMAQSTSFDMHFMSMGRRVLVGLRRIPPAPGMSDTPVDVARLVQARNLVLAFATPPMQDLVEACKPVTPTNAARRKNCRAIATSLRHSDSLTTNMIGLRLQEWTAANAADRNDALAQRRRLQWKLSQLSEAELNSAMPPARQASIMLAHENEVEGIDAVLRATHYPLHPPTDWKPSVPAPTTTAQALP